ncbi:MAG: hypothetical protein AB7P14_23575 [Blastocatellales bacterium]
MKKDIPAWAMRAVLPEDHNSALDLYRQDKMKIKWPDLNILKGWADRRGWPTPWIGFESAFIAKMLENRENFERAIRESGIEIQIPRQDWTLTVKKLRELDAMYEATEEMGALGRRPTDWGFLVDELREIRRAVEAGVTIRIEETQTVLNSWQSFYTWAHGRYHMLEDGYDSWIGDDNS